MSEDNKNPFNEKTVVQSSRSETPAPAPQNADKTVVFAQSNLKETFDARTVVRSSKPAPAALPDEAPPKVIAAELPATPPPSDADTNPDVRVSSFASASPAAEKPKLSKTERREARAALDRKTRGYMLAFGAVCVLAIATFVATLGTKPGDKPATPVAEKPTQEKTDLASETEKSPPAEAQMLGAYKPTTEVLKDFDRAAKKAQDHAVGF